ncbi:MAG: ornithine cyclodeaminase family protein [Actinomycetes bacterium]
MSEDSGLLVLSADEIESVFDVDMAIESQRVAFRELGLGHAKLPARLLIDGPEESVSFCYAARVSDETGSVCKFGSVVPRNADRGLPLIAALIAALDPVTGAPAAILDGTSVTTIRTAAASAVAAEHLANDGAARLAVLGSGVQAEAHVHALAKVLPLDAVRIWSRDAGRRESLAQRLSEASDADIQAASSAEQAVTGADVVVGCTTSAQPVFELAWVQPGATVISVGSFAAGLCEVPFDLVRTADAVVVDDVSTALEHAGPVVRAVEQNEIGQSDLVPLGEVVAGVRQARRRPEDLVFYNSVGIGVQDAAATWAVVKAARERGLGRTVNL